MRLYEKLMKGNMERLKELLKKYSEGQLNKKASNKETYESGSGTVESYTKDKSKDHDEIVLKLKDGRTVRISNNTKLGVRVEPAKGDTMNYHGHRVDGTNVVHKTHPNKKQRGGWLEHVKSAEDKRMRNFSYIGLIKIAGYESAEPTVKPTVWPDYSSLSDLDEWQLPPRSALDEFISWRTKEKGMPYDPMSIDPKFGSFRVAPGVNTYNALVSERKANGSNIDFYPLVYAGFQQQRANSSRYGHSMPGMDNERMMADARKVADVLGPQWTAYIKAQQAAEQPTLIASFRR